MELDAESRDRHRDSPAHVVHDLENIAAALRLRLEPDTHITAVLLRREQSKLCAQSPRVARHLRRLREDAFDRVQLPVRLGERCSAGTPIVEDECAFVHVRQETGIHEEIRAAAKSDETPEKADAESFEYKMQPIVLIVERGSPPAVTETRRKEAEALRNRVQTCEEANALFKSMQDAAIREVVTKTSADLPAALREVLDKTPIGHLTEPEVTKQGVEMVALCGRTPTTVDTPKKKEIRDKMFAEKYEAKSKAYLQEIRKASMIEYR